MENRKSEDRWMETVKDFKSSGSNLSAWCREKGICKSSIYPYIKKYKNQVEPVEQKWGEISIPKSIERSPISFKIGAITFDIKSGFDKEMLNDILSVVMKLC